MFRYVLFGMILSAVPLLTFFKIYSDNLTHVACKMYHGVENQGQYEYV